MQLMQMFKTILKPRYSVIATVVMVGVVASVMGLAPTHGASNTLAQDCANAPSTPTFNYWPVTYNDPEITGVPTPFCHDFPAIDAAVDTDNPVWSSSESDWNNGLAMTVGQQGAAGMYLHNGAANNLPLADTTAKNVHIITKTETTVGGSHKISVTYTADNAPTYTKSFTIHTPADAQLQVVPNTGFIYDYQGRVVLDHQNLDLGNSDYRLGNLDACFEYSLFLTFKFKVVRSVNTDTPLTITKGVKNLTVDNNTGRGAVYSSSVNANNGDRVGYKIVVTNTGTQVARGVTVTDQGATGVTIDSGSTTVGVSDDALIANNLWQGSIPGTVNIGDLQPNESRIVKYTGRVNKSDCSTLVNRATAQASNAAAVSATASVVVVNCGGHTGNPKISITKQVKNNNRGGSYTSSVNANVNDRVNFKITVSNTGDATLKNVVMTDSIPSGLRFDDSVSGDGTPTINGNTFTVNFGSISSGSSKTVEFAAVATKSCDTFVNRATATATDVNSVSATASVVVDNCGGSNPGNPNIVLSKRAYNDTKHIDAVTVNAARGDYITYSLVTTNNGNGTATNYVIQDDLSQVLPLADIVSTNGGTISGNTISYPSVTIRAGETVTKTFQVRVKQTLSSTLTYQLRNTYGNTVVINVPGTVVYTAPQTGAAGTSAVAFAGLLTAGFVIARKRGSILKFIFA